MQKERDYLVGRVFPALRSFAEERGIPFSWCDLRFGVPIFEEEYILRLCLRNIENSNPSFVGLIGDNYGSIPHNLNRTQIKRLSIFSNVPSMLHKKLGYTEIEMRYYILQYANKESFDYYFLVGAKNQSTIYGVNGIRKYFSCQLFSYILSLFNKSSIVKIQLWKKFVLKNTKQLTFYYWAYNEGGPVEEDIIYQTLRDAIEQKFPIQKFPKEELIWNEQQSYLQSILTKIIEDKIIIRNNKPINRNQDILNLYSLKASGKTFWAAYQIKLSINKGIVCFYYFVGGTRIIDTPLSIWKSILYQVCKYLNKDFSQYYCINDRDFLRDALTACLHQIDDKVLVVIDGFGNDVSCSKEHRNTFIADFPDPKNNIQYIVTSNEKILQNDRVLCQSTWFPMEIYKNFESDYAKKYYGFSNKDFVISSNYYPADYREAQYIVDELIISSNSKGANDKFTDKNDIYSCIKMRVKNLISSDNKFFQNREENFFKGLNDAILFLSLTKNGILEADVCKICNLDAEQWSILYGYLSPFFKSAGRIKIVQPLAEKFYSEYDTEGTRLQFIDNLRKYNTDLYYTLEILFQASQLKDKTILLDMFSDINILNFVYDTDKDLISRYLIVLENAQRLDEYHEKLLDSSCEIDQTDLFLFLRKIIHIFYDIFPRYNILQDYINKSDSIIEKYSIDTSKVLDYYAKKAEIYIFMGKLKDASEVLQLSEKCIEQSEGDYKQRHIQNILLRAKLYDNYIQVDGEKHKALDIYRVLIEEYQNDLEKDVLLDIIHRYIMLKKKGDDVLAYINLFASIFNNRDVIKEYSHIYYKTVNKYRTHELLLNTIFAESKDADDFFSKLFSTLKENICMYPYSRDVYENMFFVIEFTLTRIKKIKNWRKRIDNILRVNLWTEEWVKISKELFGDNSMEFLYAMLNSSRHYQNMGESYPLKKNEYLKRSMELNIATEKIYKRIFEGTSNTISAKILHNRACIYGDLSDYENAMLCINSAIDMKMNNGMLNENSLFVSKIERIHFLLEQIKHTEDLQSVYGEIDLCRYYIKEIEDNISNNEELSESMRKERLDGIKVKRELLDLYQTDERFFKVASEILGDYLVILLLKNYLSEIELNMLENKKNEFKTYIENHNLQSKFYERLADVTTEVPGVEFFSEKFLCKNCLSAQNLSIRDKIKMCFTCLFKKIGII